jgi:23S rRNA pseudouridine1911/1915/1917 synthase
LFSVFFGKLRYDIFDRVQGGDPLMFSSENLRILFEDNHLIVCLKPAGVLAQADGKELPDMLTVIKNYLKEKYQKPGNVYLGLVHRLDLNVGGVMVFAKTSKAAARLSEAIREHDFAKKYFAVVNGSMPVGERTTLTDFLTKDEETRMGFVSDAANGKEASLSYTVLETTFVGVQPLSLLAIELYSGRFHQIRIQMAHYGYSLYGDQKYGEKSHSGQEGLGLFAYELAFAHPISKAILTFSEMPKTGIFTEFHHFQK